MPLKILIWFYSTVCVMFTTNCADSRTKTARLSFFTLIVLRLSKNSITILNIKLKMIYINNAVDTKSRIFISKLATSIGLPSDCKRTMILFYTFCKVIRDRVPPMASNALITYLPKGIKQI